MTELEQYRQGINRIDGELMQLFLERMAVTGKVGEYRQRVGTPVLGVEREKQIIAAKTTLTNDPAREVGMAVLYEEIIAISRRQQRKLVWGGAEEPGYTVYAATLATRWELVAAPRMIYQGELGCYSEETVVGFFGPEVSSRGLAWFPGVFAALERGEVDYTALPAESSSAGSIRQAYDLLAQYSYYVTGECQVKVKHCLVVLPGMVPENIHTVCFHEQGLMQYERYLDAHRGWRRAPTLNTIGLAKQVAESGDHTATATCSRRVAQIYGLHILVEGISYNAMNYTRFVVVSPVLELRPDRNEISTVFHLSRQSGFLHEVLTMFIVQGLNLPKIGPRPIPGRGWEYLLFPGLTGDLVAPEMDGVLHELGQLAAGFHILRSSREYEP